MNIRAITGVPNLCLTMYPFTISTGQHVLIKFLMTKRLSKISKFHRILTELLYFRIFGNNKYINIFSLLLLTLNVALPLSMERNPFSAKNQTL